MRYPKNLSYLHLHTHNGCSPFTLASVRRIPSESRAPFIHRYWPQLIIHRISEDTCDRRREGEREGGSPDARIGAHLLQFARTTLAIIGIKSTCVDSDLRAEKRRSDMWAHALGSLSIYLSAGRLYIYIYTHIYTCMYTHIFMYISTLNLMSHPFRSAG